MEILKPSHITSICKKLTQRNASSRNNSDNVYLQFCCAKFKFSRMLILFYLFHITKGTGSVKLE